MAKLKYLDENLRNNIKFYKEIYDSAQKLIKKTNFLKGYDKFSKRNYEKNIILWSIGMERLLQSLFVKHGFIIYKLKNEVIANRKIIDTSYTKEQFLNQVISFSNFSFEENIKYILFQQIHSKKDIYKKQIKKLMEIRNNVVHFGITHEKISENEYNEFKEFYKMLIDEITYVESEQMYHINLLFDFKNKNNVIITKMHLINKKNSKYDINLNLSIGKVVFFKAKDEKEEFHRGRGLWRPGKDEKEYLSRYNKLFDKIFKVIKKSLKDNKMEIDKNYSIYASDYNADKVEKKIFLYAVTKYLESRRFG